MVTEEQLAAKVQELLQNCDLKKTTNSIVFKKLEDVFGVDLSDKKPFLRHQIGLFLQSQYVLSEEYDHNGDVTREYDDDDDDEKDDVSDDTIVNEEEYDNGDKLYDKVPEVKIENFGECKLNESDTFENYGAARLDGLSDILKRPRKKKEKIKRTCFSGKYCTLSPELQKFLGVRHLTRTEAIKQLWTYVKEKSLQDPNDDNTILCDEMLRGLFGVDSINILQINKALTEHITPSAKLRCYKRKQEKQEENLCGDESNEKRQKKEASVFFPPLPLSDTLKRFLGTGETALTRADVIKRVWDYIRQKNLKDPTDKKTIICDEKLKELVNVDSFHGFTVTKLLSPHFVKT